MTSDGISQHGVSTTAVLTTLGAPRLVISGRQSDLDPRSLAVLAYLADLGTGVIVSRDELVEVFWPRAPINNARHSISQVIHSIHSKAPELDLIASREDLRLTTPLQWDVSTAEHSFSNADIASGVRQIGGAFLATVDVSSNRFEDWRASIDARLIRQIEARLPAWIEECRFRSDWRAFRTAIRTLRSAYGSIVDEILAAIGGATADSNADPEQIADPGIVPLLGRHKQHQLLLNARDKAHQQSGTVQLLLADSGMGKTRLCTAFLGTINNCPTISIACYENARNHGFGALRQIALHPSIASAVIKLPEPWKSVMRALVDDTVSHERGELEDWRQFAFEAAARLFESIESKSPLVVFIDDAQWMDSASLSCLSYVAHKERRSSVLWLLSARPENGAVPRPLAALLQATNGKTIHLGPLTLDEIHPFTSAVAEPLKARELATEILKLTAGHPFLIAELIHRIEVGHGRAWTTTAVREAAESSVLQEVADRFGTISPHSRRLLAVVAVADQPLPHTSVRRIAGLGGLSFLSAFEDLILRGLITDLDGKISCRHTLIREIIYKSLTTTQKAILHVRVARELRHRGAAAEDVVSHYARSRQRKGLYIWALRAAKANYRNTSADEADHFLRLAARGTKSRRKRMAILWRRANDAHDAGRLNRAIPLYKRICRTHELTHNRRKYIEARLLDAECLVGNLNSKELNERGLTIANETFAADTIDVHVQCLRSLVRYNFLRSNFSEATAAVARMEAVSSTFPGTQGAARALTWGAIIKLAEGDGLSADLLADEALRESSRFDDPRLKADALTVRIMTKAFVGRLSEAYAACEEGIRIAEHHRFFRFRNMCLANMSAVAMDMGLETVAEQNLDEVVRAAESNEVLADIAHGYFNLAVLRLTQNRYREVNDLAERCIDLAGRCGNHFIVMSCHALIGTCALERGSFHEAHSRKVTILNNERSYIGDDILPIEHFLARMSEIEHRIPDGIARLERLVREPPPFANACCQLELKLELARLLAKTDFPRALSLAEEVRCTSSNYGAAAITQNAEAFLLRHASR